MERVTLSEIIPTDVLQMIQDAFSNYSGLAAMIADANGVPVTRQSGFTEFCKRTRQSPCGAKNCQRCGREGAHRTLETGRPSVYRCHTGMMDFAAPILLNGEYIGHFAGGQTRVAELDEEFLRKKAEEYDIDPEEYIDQAKKSPVTDPEMVQKAAEFLSSIAAAMSQIAFERRQVIEEKLLLEQTAGTQMRFMRQYALGANEGIQPLTDLLRQIGRGEKQEIDDAMRQFCMEQANDIQHRISSINDSVNRSEIGHGGVRLKESRYDIRLLFDRKLSEMTTYGLEQGAEVTYEIEPTVPQYLVGDAARISSVIGEAVRVAIVHEKGRHVHVHVSTKTIGYGTKLVIAVKDDGDGVTEDIRQRLLSFIRSRVENEAWEEDYLYADMASIGHLMQAMSGQVDIESTPGEGATMFIAIPQLAIRQTSAG